MQVAHLATTKATDSTKVSVTQELEGGDGLHLEETLEEGGGEEGVVYLEFETLSRKSRTVVMVHGEQCFFFSRNTA